MTNTNVLKTARGEVTSGGNTMLEREDAIVVSVLEQLAQRRRHETFATIAKTTEQMRRGAEVILEPLATYSAAPYKGDKNYKEVNI